MKRKDDAAGAPPVCKPSENRRGEVQHGNLIVPAKASRASAAQLNAKHSSMQSYTLLPVVSTNSSITWHQIDITFTRYLK
jgi:hypothetical protein